MENITDFILAALPWVLLATLLAVILANYERIVKDKATGRRVAGGMCVGAALGLVLAKLAGLSAGIGIGAGVLVGMIAGFLLSGRKHCEE